MFMYMTSMPEPTRRLATASWFAFMPSNSLSSPRNNTRSGRRLELLSTRSGWLRALASSTDSP